MANKVIIIKSDENKRPSPEWTYADISMTAEARGRKYLAYTEPSNEEPMGADLNYNKINEEYEKGGKYRVGRNTNVDAVKRCVHNIFYWTPGERVLDPEFGNTIRKYLYEKINTFTVEAIVAEIQNLISKYEPRCIIDNVKRVEDEMQTNTENNQVALIMLWHVDGLPEDQYQQELIF